jgi:hypothetical protein
MITSYDDKNKKVKIARQALEDEEFRPRLPWLGLIVVSLVEHANQPDKASKPGPTDANLETKTPCRLSAS